MAKLKSIRKLKGATDLVQMALTVIVVVVVLVVGLFVVNQVNQTTPVHLGINLQQIFTLIGVALIVVVASTIIYYLRTSFQSGGI